MDLLTVVIITVIATVGVCSILFVYVNARKNGEQEIPWDKIRPILTEVFTESMKLMDARSLGYEGIENYCVAFLKKKIDAASFIEQEEKAFLTEEFLRTIIRPRLKELYSENVSTKRIGE